MPKTAKKEEISGVIGEIKKVPVKKEAKRVVKKKKEARPEECFWVNNGPICKNIKELKKALETMTDAQYHYHTKRGGNDFSKWLLDVLGHEKCAQKLKRARSRTGAATALGTCDD